MKRENWILSIVLFLGLFVCVFSDRQSCITKRWCNDCITAHSDCAWCNDKGYRETRCDLIDELRSKKCVDIVSPNNTETKIEDKPLKDGSQGGSDPIQLRPQKVKLKLRPGRPQHLNMTYRIAEQLPIDMYFVLDFTTTMKDRLQGLAELTDTLITSLQNEFTNNIHIGFGSFVDKPLQPYSLTTPAQLENPCLVQKTTCVKSYGYIHRQKLNSDITSFINAIKNGNTSSNWDPMEGGLDAIMQAAVCPEIIGWRSQSRRVLVYISDGGFHFAGDGKLAGIDKPNDAKCYMDKYAEAGMAWNNQEYIYSHSETLDYPSYGILSKALDENRINTFFVVDPVYKSLYEGLSGVIEQAETAIMDRTSARGIVEHIKEYYTKLSEKIEISASDLPDEVDVKIASDCSGNRVVNTWNLKEHNAKCISLKIGTPVFFNVTVNLVECPKDPSKRSHTIKILPGGLQESLEIEIEYTCDCKCETSATLDDEECSGGNGTYECGVCKCNPGRSGNICQCDKDSVTDINADNCKLNKNLSVICENHGTCKCGQCDCSPNYEGPQCQCESGKCKMKGSNLKCSGKDRGECSCDRCKCNGAYHGEFCQCEPSSNCIDKNGLICGGKGECNCAGKCECHINYEGDKCEKCPKCDRCRKCGYRSCVQCLEKTGVSGHHNTTNTECVLECSVPNITRVDRFKRDQDPCGFIDADKCEINYLVECDANDNVYLHIAKGKLCTHPPDPLLIAMPVLGGILGVGLLLLVIWKILTLFYDKIEYARFEHEIQNAKWTKVDNPIYKTPVTSNQNPVYKGTVD